MYDETILKPGMLDYEPYLAREDKIATSNT